MKLTLLLATLFGLCASERTFKRPIVGSNSCNYPDIWLIPGTADTSCKRPNLPDLIDVNSVKITPEVIKIPGCFTIEMDVRIASDPHLFPSSYLGKIEYQWWNLDGFGSLQCQDAESNGCGGYGNNCYYCDLCNQLEQLNRRSRVSKPILEQFQGIRCPNSSGTFRLRREFCLNDYSVLDEDGDCQFDFLGNSGGDAARVWSDLQQVGFGTLIAKFHLAHNATAGQLQKKRNKEAEIRQGVIDELLSRSGRTEWNPRLESHFAPRINLRLDNWHKNRYLPWLIYTNQMACLKVTFDVCDKHPQPVDNDPFASVFGQGKYTCEAL